MRIALKDRVPGGIDFGLLYGGIAVICLLAFHYLPVRQLFPPCAFKYMTGIPCPTCGTTRAVMLLVQGDIAGSLFMNPMLSIVLLGVVLWFVFSLVAWVMNLKQPSLSLSTREKDVVRLFAVLLFLANWVYLIMMV